MSVTGRIVGQPVYHPYTDRHGDRLRVAFTQSDRLWPWVGYLAVQLSVAESPDDRLASARFSGIAEGFISLTVASASDEDEGVSVQCLVMVLYGNRYVKCVL